jgi:membrane protein DedA with SNARE-associated domain
MAMLVELLIVLGFSFGVGLIPFAGPSNMLVASTWAISLGYTDPVSLVAIGFMVALGAALAKSVHYMITFFIGGHLGEKRRQRLDADVNKIRKWAFWLLFAAAATPIPDEPVVIPLGLMKYNPIKFFTSFFTGKLTITISGAFLGALTGEVLSEWLSPTTTIIASIVLTVAVTVVLLKVDLGKLFQQFMQKLGRKPPEPTEEKSK